MIETGEGEELEPGICGLCDAEVWTDSDGIVHDDPDGAVEHECEEDEEYEL